MLHTKLSLSEEIEHVFPATDHGIHSYFFNVLLTKNYKLI